MGSDNDDIGEEMESIAYKSDSDVSLAQSAIMEGLKVKLHIDPRNMAYMGVSPRAIAYSKLKIIVFLIHMWVKHHQFQDVVKKVGLLLFVMVVILLFFFRRSSNN